MPKLVSKNRLSEPAGVALQHVAEYLYIHSFMLSRWRKELSEGKIMAKETDVDKAVVG